MPAVRTLFCGFGPSAQSAAKLLLRRGEAAQSMRVLEPAPDGAPAAERMGIIRVDRGMDDLPDFLAPSLTK